MTPSPITSNSSAAALNAALTSQANSASGSSSNSAAGVASSSDALANENTFLQLLVAQLKNQDPESPSDPTQFVGELAQFTSLEEQTGSRQDLDAIKTVLAASSAAAAATAPANSTTPANSTNS